MAIFLGAGRFGGRRRVRPEDGGSESRMVKWTVMRVGWRTGDVGAVRWVVGGEEVSEKVGVGEERKGEEVKAGLSGC